MMSSAEHAPATRFDPRPDHTRPGVAVPPGATDCHLHVFGPEARYPWAARRAYTPPDALLAQYDAAAAQVGLERAVLVQPTVYGTDNRAMLDALRALGPARARGVAVIGPEVDSAALAAMARQGVRGARLVTHPQAEPASVAPRIAALADRLAPLGWHLELLVTAPMIAALAERIAALPVPVVFGHMGLPRAAGGLDQPGFAALRALLRDGGGQCWAKLSGAYRVSAEPAGFGDSRAFARALYDANPRRVVWGSDWPHTGERVDSTKGAAGRVSFRDLDLGALLGLLADSLPDAASLHRVLVDNPAVLYGFASEGSCAWT